MWNEHGQTVFFGIFCFFVFQVCFMCKVPLFCHRTKRKLVSYGEWKARTEKKKSGMSRCRWTEEKRKKYSKFCRVCCVHAVAYQNYASACAAHSARIIKTWSIVRNLNIVSGAMPYNTSICARSSDACSMLGSRDGDIQSSGIYNHT